MDKIAFTSRLIGADLRQLQKLKRKELEALLLKTADMLYDEHDKRCSAELVLDAEAFVRPARGGDDRQRVLAAVKDAVRLNRADKQDKPLKERGRPNDIARAVKIVETRAPEIGLKAARLEAKSNTGLSLSTINKATAKKGAKGAPKKKAQMIC